MSEVIGSQLYVLGGFDGYSPLLSVEKCDLTQEEVKFTEMPRSNRLMSPLKNAVSFVHKGQIIIVGGWDERDTSNTIYRYDPSTDTCDYVCRLPTRIEGHSVALLKDHAYIIGGFDSFGVTDKVIKLNLETNSAMVLPGCKLIQKRENHTSQVLDGDKIVIVGGWNGK
jgi:N-acetylneuraminic acid mutarotase